MDRIIPDRERIAMGAILDELERRRLARLANGGILPTTVCQNTEDAHEREHHIRQGQHRGTGKKRV